MTFTTPVIIMEGWVRCEYLSKDDMVTVLPSFKLKFLKTRKTFNFIDCKQAYNVPIQPQGNLKSWRAYHYV